MDEIEEYRERIYEHIERRSGLDRRAPKLNTKEYSTGDTLISLLPVLGIGLYFAGLLAYAIRHRVFH